jgi:queuosine precursor transporter
LRSTGDRDFDLWNYGTAARRLTVAPVSLTDKRMTASVPRSLFVFSVFYGGMVPLGGFLGAKQAALGPLAVEAGIFPFLTLIAVSSAIAELHGRAVADRLVRYGFVPLVIAILLAFFVLQLPTDPGMYEPAKEAFPIIVGQSWRMMAAGILAYGVSVTLNVWLFDRLRSMAGGYAGLRGIVAAVLSQIVDTLIFITVSFYGVRPIWDLMLGQMAAKIVLSIVMVPLVIALVVRIGRRLDADAPTA